MPEPTPKSLLLRFGPQIVVALLGLGAGYKALDMTVAQKADRSELLALDNKVEREFARRFAVTDSLLREVLAGQQLQNREVRALRIVVCLKESADSFCRERTP